jgi:fatty acid-binding protein DegV
MSVKIITDSTCALPEELFKELVIAVVLFNVYSGEQVYSDGVDIQADVMHEHLSGVADKAMMARGRFGPAIGAYVGPRALGVAVRQSV